MDKQDLEVTIRISSYPCEIRVYVDEKGECTIRKIYEDEKHERH